MLHLISQFLPMNESISRIIFAAVRLPEKFSKMIECQNLDCNFSKSISDLRNLTLTILSLDMLTLRSMIQLYSIGCINISMKKF